MVIADPKLALIVGLSVGGAYGIIFIIRHYLNIIGKVRLKSNELRFKSVSEAFGASKEVKIGGLEKKYIQKFSDPAQIYAKTQASSQAINLIPRF